MPPKTGKSKTRSARPRPTGWLTSDANEVDLRRRRGEQEPMDIEPVNAAEGFFGDFRVHSNGRTYGVEVRSLAELVNSCDCADHRVNGLGTCKHVEAVLHRLRRRRAQAFAQAAAAGSPYHEVYLDRRNRRVRLARPRGGRRGSGADRLLAAHGDGDGALAGNALDTLPALLRAVAAAHPATRRRIRVSAALQAWLEEEDRREERHRYRQHLEAEIAAGRLDLDLVSHPLYPYQQEGMLHLALTGRALLADEMGLGKTVQAVAACELLRRTAGIRRVLVVAPASLKGEWEEQIAKFAALPSLIVQGSRAERERQYGAPAFFYLANYEQIRPDAAFINENLAPDVVILDEAQRIKNWQTRTAAAVKGLESAYAFVLTGTPVENRIDEIYSIAEFLDPHIFGPLFRFNRDFYQLDDKGRAVGYKNLDGLHERLRPVMLRRRKDEVEGQLPGRTINTYFVPMHEEQTARYDDFQAKVARLSAMARKRPLKKEEMKRLQQNLACMRMICDTPYIIERECRVSPKLKELEAILAELMEDGDHKVLVFSEWERMLELVRERAEARGIGHAWHTGKVPQPRRRAEIRRFKEDPACRLFLSTDSGSVGLNLQAADVVINLDLPWNPARLEQRIARAWRKHQRRPVQVINLVSEHTIEHRMLTLLEQKRALAAGVIDGRGDTEMALPSGRAAFLERLDALMERQGAAVRPPDPMGQLRDTLTAVAGDGLERAELHGEGGQPTVVAVTRDAAGQAGLERRLREHLPQDGPQLQVVDRDAYATIQRLVEAGVLQFVAQPMPLYEATAEVVSEDPSVRRLAEAREIAARGRRPREMANLLHQGGFTVEAYVPLAAAVNAVLRALLHWQGHEVESVPDLALVESVLVTPGLLRPDTAAVVARLRDGGEVPDVAAGTRLFGQAEQLLAEATSLLEGGG